MYRWLIFCIVIALSGCSFSPEPDKLNNTILYSKDGCAFYVRKNVGDTIFLSFMKEESKETCNFKQWESK